MIEKKMKIIGSFIKPEHLDIDPKRLNHARIERAIGELQRMNKFKTPRDKMVLIMNSCKIIGLMLKETNKSKVAEGADMFFPCIIYALLKGCPKDVKSHVEYIKLYRNPEMLESEDDYFLTTMSSAVDFVGNMIGDDLNIEKSEYSNLYNRYDEEKGTEVDQRASQRKERNYDEYENQSDVSCMTTQSSAELLGELESMDVPIVHSALRLNKGIQTNEVKEEVKENKSQNLNDNSTSSAHNAFVAEIDNKIVMKYESFWGEKLKDDFDEMTMADVKKMHKIMLCMKKVFKNKSKLESEHSPEMKALSKPKLDGKTQNEELYDIFVGQQEQNEQQQEQQQDPSDKLADGLDDLNDIFS
jgi:hypothetical protein